jgi:cell division protein FtsN
MKVSSWLLVSPAIAIGLTLVAVAVAVAIVIILFAANFTVANAQEQKHQSQHL